MAEVTLCYMCHDEVDLYRKAKLCNKCYAWTHYWSKKSPAQQVKYQQKVDRAATRIAIRYGARKAKPGKNALKRLQ